MQLQVDEITRDTLDQLEEQWEQTRLKNLVRDEVVKLGRDHRQAQIHAERVEGQCMIRARKLFMLGFERREIAELFGATRAVVDRWTRGMDE